MRSLKNSITSWKRSEVSEEELRVNYENLLATRQQLEEERQNYVDLFENAPVAYLVTDLKGIIREANQAAYTLLNVRPGFLMKRPLSRYISKADRRILYRLLQVEKRMEAVELSLQRQDEEGIIASVTLVPIRDSWNERVGLRWMMQNITPQKEAQEALAASEARFKTVFQDSSIGMLLVDLEGKVVECNRAFREMTDHRWDELEGQPFNSLVFPADLPTVQRTITRIMQTSQENSQIEVRLRTRAEETLWARMAISPLRDSHQRIKYLLHLVENISQEKYLAAEKEEMHRRLLVSGEEERLHLAQELHDGPMQEIYGVLFKLSLSRSLLTDPDPIKNIKEAENWLKEVNDTLRSICGELRPPTLANLGLERAIRSHAGKILELHPELKIDLQLEADEDLLTQEARLSLFRIYQQCMMNVLRHAEASEVEVQFSLENEAVNLSVKDNGQGFAMPKKLVHLIRNGRYGLAGIAERVNAMDGALQVESEPGRGTRISVRIPRANVSPTS